MNIKTSIFSYFLSYRAKRALFNLNIVTAASAYSQVRRLFLLLLFFVILESYSLLFASTVSKVDDNRPLESEDSSSSLILLSDQRAIIKDPISVRSIFPVLTQFARSEKGHQAFYRQEMENQILCWNTSQGYHYSILPGEEDKPLLNAPTELIQLFCGILSQQNSDYDYQAATKGELAVIGFNQDAYSWIMLEQKKEPSLSSRSMNSDSEEPFSPPLAKASTKDSKNQSWFPLWWFTGASSSSNATIASAVKTASSTTADRTALKTGAEDALISGVEVLGEGAALSALAATLAPELAALAVGEGAILGGEAALAELETVETSSGFSKWIGTTFSKLAKNATDLSRGKLCSVSPEPILEKVETEATQSFKLLFQPIDETGISPLSDVERDRLSDALLAKAKAIIDQPTSSLSRIPSSSSLLGAGDEHEYEFVDWNHF